MAEWWVYIVDKKGRYYVGITTNIPKRLSEHGNSPLLYYEGPQHRDSAVKRERELKGWSRKKKQLLIESRILNGSYSNNQLT